MDAAIDRAVGFLQGTSQQQPGQFSNELYPNSVNNLQGVAHARTPRQQQVPQMNQQDPEQAGIPDLECSHAWVREEQEIWMEMHTIQSQMLQLMQGPHGQVSGVLQLGATMIDVQQLSVRQVS